MNLPPVPRVETCVTVSTATALDLTRPRRDHAGADRAAALRRRAWGYARTLAGLGILASLAWKVGTGGFLAALRVIDADTLLAAGGIGLFTTVLNAWRWCLVARGLGIALPLRTATAACYRAAFLNTALPGGVLGDVHRAVRHGQDLGDLGLGVRAVALERFAGQAVVVATGLGLLLALPSPARPSLAAVPAGLVVGAVAGVLAAVAVALAARGTLRRAASRWARAGRTGVMAVRHGLLSRRAFPGIVAASVGVLAGYLAMFLLAARAAGATAPTAHLLPLLVYALLAMAIPVNVGGWGPREGACAWAFAAAGFGASQGITVAVVYGLSAFAASLPGAGVVLAHWLARRRQRLTAAVPAPARPADTTGPAGQAAPAGYRSESA